MSSIASQQAKPSPVVLSIEGKSAHPFPASMTSLISAAVNPRSSILFFRRVLRATAHTPHAERQDCNNEQHLDCFFQDWEEAIPIDLCHYHR